MRWALWFGKGHSGQSHPTWSGIRFYQQQLLSAAAVFMHYFSGAVAAIE